MGFLDTIRTSPLEAKKQGYEEAAKQYVPAFNKVRREYRRAIAYYKEQKENYNKETDELLMQMKELEKLRDELQEELNSKITESSKKLGVSTASLMAGGVLFSPTLIFLFKIKERKLEAARQEGYNEARALYTKKISELQKKLKELCEEGDRVLGKYDEMIVRMLDEISELLLSTANLKILISRMEGTK